jgi:protein-disulfide isomerase
VRALGVVTALLLAVWAGDAAAQEPPRVTADPAMIRGAPAAPVTIVEWSDYQCPYCRRVEGTLASLLVEFAGSVRIVFKDFPLASHDRALPAALAARCAGAQGRYWEYHDLLFVAQPEFSRDQLVGYARRLGLEAASFTTCLDTARFQDAVLADRREGREAGVEGTPTFFINGEKLVGALPIEDFRAAIRRALDAAGPARR